MWARTFAGLRRSGLRCRAFGVSRFDVEGSGVFGLGFNLGLYGSACN